MNDDKKKYYKAFVSHEGKTDYIQLSKLPVPAKYMAYFLQETIRVKVNKSGQLDFISLQMIDTTKFQIKMNALEAQTF